MGLARWHHAGNGGLRSSWRRCCPRCRRPRLQPQRLSKRSGPLHAPHLPRQPPQRRRSATAAPSPAATSRSTMRAQPRIAARCSRLFLAEESPSSTGLFTAMLRSAPESAMSSAVASSRHDAMAKCSTAGAG